jgi:Peptidase family S41
MKRSFVLLAAFALAIGLLSARARAETETSKRFEPAQLHEDFRIARRSLEEGHSGLYRYTNKAELDRIFDETEESLDHSMDLYEFYRAMAPMIAAIKCGHTDLSMPADVEAELQRLPWFPFAIKVLDSKAYIFRDYAKGGMLAGKEIQAINGVPTAHIISTMLAAESQDGDGHASRQRNIGGHFGVNLITLLGLRAPYTVVLGGDGKKDLDLVQVAGLSRDDLNKMSKMLFPQDQPKTDFAELKFLDSGQIARLTYSSFGTSSEEGQKFMKRAFEGIQSKGSRALILDLRGNGGGEDELGKLLFSYLLDTPFKYYDDLIINGMNFSFSKYTTNHADLTVPAAMAERRADGRVHVIDHPNLGLQQPSHPIFNGPVYILIDGGCFSTTAEFLTEAQSHHRATFIGEESAGGYYGNTSGSVVRITLPNTKLGVFIPLMTYYMSVGGKHEHEAARGVIPDFPVRHTIADLEVGVDRDFELALALARKSR